MARDLRDELSFQLSTSKLIAQVSSEMATRTEPYKIAIFGAGGAGCLIIREATRLPEFEVVGALVFSDKKNGIDIGTLAGIKPLGIKTTKDLDQFLSIKCDAVIHLSMDAPHIDTLQQFVTLLEAGKNVVTSHPYSYLPAREASFGDAIKKACEKGQSTFYAAGLNPDLMTQRVTPMLTNLSNDVKRIVIEEHTDCQWQQEPTMLHVIGLGQEMSQVGNEDSPALWYQRHYNYQMIQHVCHELGIDDIELRGHVDCSAAPEDFVRDVLTIPKGKCASISYTSAGYVGNEAFMSITITYYFGQLMKPPHMAEDNAYIITIEGRPSTRTVVSVKPSYLTDASQTEGEPAPVTYHIFANAILHSIPIAVESPPGFRAVDFPVVHWKKDQRKNVGRRYEEARPV